MKIILSLILLTCSLFSRKVFAESSDISLVKIESKYADLRDKNRKLTVTGSGFLVENQNQLFVITASHVSQGEDLSITYQGKSLKVIGRLYDGLTDVEVIEVEKNVSSSFHLYSNWIKWEFTADRLKKIIDKNNFVLINDWVIDPNLQVDNQFQQNLVLQINCDVFCYTINAETLMQPGSSGSPLVTQVQDQAFEPNKLNYDARESLPLAPAGAYQLRGLVIRRERFFTGSTFIPASRILKIINSYLKGNRTNVSTLESRWLLSGPALVRLAQNGSVESAATGSSSGNGVSMDGGNLEALNEDHPFDVFNHITAFPVDTDNKELFYWILAMRHPFSSQLINFPVWYDLEQVNQIRRFTLGLVAADPTALISVFETRLSKNQNNQELMDLAGSSSIQSLNHELIFKIKISSNEVLNFKLNQKGYLCLPQTQNCAQRFDPIIEVPSNQNVTYLIDLRNFLFVNMSEQKNLSYRDESVLNLSQDEWTKKFYDYLSSLYGKLSLSVRRQRVQALTPLKAEEGKKIIYSWDL